MFRGFFEKRKRGKAEEKRLKQMQQIFNEEFKNYNKTGKTIWIEFSAMCKNYNKENTLSREIVIKTTDAVLIINYKNLEVVKSEFTVSKHLPLAEQEKIKEILYKFFEDLHDKIIKKIVLSHNVDCFDFY
ncbi:hypothetical protein LGK95_22120 [Clostridium algoriphilum]|uniref:hypothetical protein n=1 Tax=Clostridium algoriphilum TaxID=198347 RepID=UPI001CF225A5|nr:hypothetical protein [Clostridium algoriphilum]MCB2296143.1 hypothetical protein [Clostridium algoriphilum]